MGVPRSLTRWVQPGTRGIKIQYLLPPYQDNLAASAHPHRETTNILYGAQHNFNSEKVRTQDFPYICDIIGEPVCCDAAQFGSYCHRLRNYWTNAADSHVIAEILEKVQRPEGIQVNSILEPGHITLPVTRVDFPPFYPANTVGQPRSALPTLVSYPGSHSFRVNGPGMILNTTTNQ